MSSDLFPDRRSLLNSIFIALQPGEGTEGWWGEMSFQESQVKDDFIFNDRPEQQADFDQRQTGPFGFRRQSDMGIL